MPRRRGGCREVGFLYKGASVEVRSEIAAELGVATRVLDVERDVDRGSGCAKR